MLLFNTVHLSTRGRLLLNKQWGRSPWSTRRSGGRWRPSWRRSNPQSWAGRRPRRRRLLRRHYPVRENEADPVDISKKDKSEGFGRYELFIPGQSKKILSLANFERNPLTTAMDSTVDSVVDSVVDSKVDSMVDSMLPSENSFGANPADHFLQSGSNVRFYFPPKSKTQEAQRKPKKSKAVARPRIVRVRRKKTMKRGRKVDLDGKDSPKKLFPKNDQKDKSKLSGQDRLLLDVIFPQRLFSENQYVKTKLDKQPE